jgi:bacillithiol biosynthesis deacetylase BshB1
MESEVLLDILAIGAHPDDVELSCAGTVIKCVKQGKKVGILDLTDGELGTRGTREVRLREAEKAAGIMGVTVRKGLALPDGQIATTRSSLIQLITVLRQYRPDTLLFPYSEDRHPDHEHAHVLCREAWFYSGLAKIETLDEKGQPQEAFRPRRYFCFMQWFEFVPSFIVDISEEFDQRLAAIRAFRSQFHDPESSERETVLSTPAFMEMIRTRAEYYGDRIGVKYGEPFFSPHIPGIRNLFDLT